MFPLALSAPSPTSYSSSPISPSPLTSSFAESTSTSLFLSIFEHEQWDNSNVSKIASISSYESNSTYNEFLESGNTTRLYPRRPSFRPRFVMSATRETVMILSYYSCPAILAIGVISNLLVYLVFTRTRLRKVIFELIIT